MGGLVLLFETFLDIQRRIYVSEFKTTRQRYPKSHRAMPSLADFAWRAFQCKHRILLFIGWALYVVAETDHELGPNILNRAVYRVSVPDQRGEDPGSYTSMSNVHSAALVLSDRLLKSRRRISMVRGPKLEKRKLEELTSSFN